MAGCAMRGKLIGQFFSALHYRAKDNLNKGGLKS